MSDDDFEGLRKLRALQDALDPPWLRQIRELRDAVDPPALRQVRELRDAVDPPALRQVRELRDAVDPPALRQTGLLQDAVTPPIIKQIGLIRDATTPPEVRCLANLPLAVVPRGSDLTEAIRRIRSDFGPPPALSDIVQRLGYHDLRRAVELANGGCLEVRIGRLDVAGLDIRGVFSSSDNNNDLAHDVDTIVDALGDLAATSATKPPDDSTGQDHAAEAESSSAAWTNTQAGRSRVVAAQRRSARLWKARTSQDRISFQPLHVFCGSAAVDAMHREALMAHLSVIRSSGLIKVWHDGAIAPGEDHVQVRTHQLSIAKLLLLLVSSDYIAELYDSGLMRAVEAQSMRAVVIPVLLRPVDYDGTFLADLSPLPRDGAPVTTWTNPDAAWTNVARGVRAVVESLRVRTHEVSSLLARQIMRARRS